jgi:hypothetical protein
MGRCAVVGHSKRSQRKAPEVSEEVAISRYDHLLDILPVTIIRSGHASVFGDLPPDQRMQFNEASESATDPGALRDALTRQGVLEQVARQFPMTDAVRVYFSTGAGSVSIDTQPPWIGELVNYESAPVDAGTMHHRKGVNSGVWF